MSSNIQKLSEREHLLLRPAMYIGSIDLTKTSDYILEDNKIVYKELEYVPGLIKIINEIIDNSVDVAIKSDFKSSTIINVSIKDNTVTVQDNGTGIPVKMSNGHYMPELAWGHARAGSNFTDDENRTQIGMNGVGSFATNCFSTEFIGETNDGENFYKIVFTENASKFKETIKKSSGKTGTKVTFKPDLTKFNITDIDDIHESIIKQRLINLSMSFPKITFKYNSRKININSFKKYVQMFSENAEIIETDNYKLAIMPNAEDDFRQFSYVNGLKISDGGTHIDFLTVNITSRLKDNLIKKYKNIKVGDIKNKLMVIAFLTDFKNAKFNSQSKEKITNSHGEVSKYYGNIDFVDLTKRMMKNKEIIDPITEVYRIKEELKRRQEMKNLKKSVKKIKSEKYLPSIGVKKYLLLVEGESALGGLSPVLGRRECGYYTLKGKPLNAYSAPQSKFTSNKELSELYKIINAENYDYVIYATDQDLDGFHIRGLLTGFFVKYLPELKGKIGILQTPVIGIKKNKKLVRWHYNLSDEVKVNSGETSKYYKGLGSWKESDLKEIVNKDGITKMIDMLEFDNDKIIDDWLGNNTEIRKEYILANDFSIAKL